MTILNNSISNIFVLIAIAVVLVLLFSFIKSYLPLLTKQLKLDNKKYKHWVYVIEIIALLVVAVVFISLSFERNVVLSVVLMLVLVFVLYYIAQFFLKDYLAGLLIKASKEYSNGDQISVGDTKGKIDHFSKTQLKIKNTDGENIYIPYSLLISKAQIVEQDTEKINTYTFEVEMSHKAVFIENIENMKSYIQLLPWIHPSLPTSVDIVEENKDSYHLSITIYALDKKYYQKVEQSVKAYITKENLSTE